MPSDERVQLKGGLSCPRSFIAFLLALKVKKSKKFFSEKKVKKNEKIQENWQPFHQDLAKSLDFVRVFVSEIVSELFPVKKKFEKKTKFTI